MCVVVAAKTTANLKLSKLGEGLDSLWCGTAIIVVAGQSKVKTGELLAVGGGSRGSKLDAVLHQLTLSVCWVRKVSGWIRSC